MDTTEAVTTAALGAAAQAGDVARLQSLLAQDASAVNTLDDGGWTPLHLAAYFGHTEAAQVLLDHGADAQAWSDNEMRNQPLHAATAGPQKDQAPAMAALLLAHGADVNTA